MIQPKPKKKMPFIVFMILVLFAFCVFCSIVSLTMDKLGLLPTETPKPPPTQTSLPTQTPLPSPTIPPTATLAPLDALKFQIETALGESNRNVPRLTSFDWTESDKVLMIRWAVNDNLGTDLILIGVQTDVTDMLQIIAQSGLLPDYQFVNFVGTFPLQDAFGNVSEERIVTATYDKATVDKINWENFQYPNIFTIADFASLHPEFSNP